MLPDALDNLFVKHFDTHMASLTDSLRTIPGAMTSEVYFVRGVSVVTNSEQIVPSRQRNEEVFCKRKFIS